MIVIPTINSFIRVLHALPEVGDVDVYINEDLLAKNLAYKHMSRYIPIGPGNNKVQAYPAGDKTSPIIDTEVDLPPDEVITLAAIGVAPDFQVLPILQTNITVNPDQAKIRFAQLSPDAPRLDLFVDSYKLFSKVRYKQVTDYTAITPGTRDVQLKPSEDNDLILAEANLKFKAGKSYTVYAVGLNEGTPPLQIIYYEEALPVVNGKEEVREEVKKFVPKEIKKTIPSDGNNVKITFKYV